MIFKFLIIIAFGLLFGLIVGLLLKIHTVNQFILTQDALNREVYKFLEAIQKQQVKNTSDIKLLLNGTTATLKELDEFKLQIANTFTELNKYFNGETSQVDFEQQEDEDKSKLN